LSYVLPLFDRIKENDDDIPEETQIGAPRAIILTPTRELNFQVFKVLKSVAHHCKLRIRQLKSGDKGGSARNLREQAFDILVTGVGSLEEAIKRKEIKTDLLEFFILDEADQLLDLGFGKSIARIVKGMKSENYCVGLFSATWPKGYKDFVESTFEGHKLKELALREGHHLVSTIETYNVYLGAREKPDMLHAFCQTKAKGTGVIFANTKERATFVADHLREHFPRRKIWLLHGELKPRERKQAYLNFVDYGGILVSTDITARGMDIKELKWVLNYDLPFEAIYYLHRAGRTGRMGSRGRVFNFVTAADKNIIGRINESILSQTALLMEMIHLAGGKTQKKVTKPSKKKISSKKPSKVSKKKIVKRRPGFSRRKKKR
jgi:superfamily II DNA/RNA helicase